MKCFPVLLSLLLLLPPALRAQAAAETAPEAPAAAPAAPTAEAPASAPPAPEAVSPAPAEVAPEAPAAAPVAPAPAATDKPRRAEPSSNREVVMFGDDALLPAGERAREVVAIFGNSVVEGDVSGEVVAILGDVAVNGTAQEAVAVLGNVHIAGVVRGDVVAVLGSVQLGPNARVEGEVVSILGTVERAPGSVVQRSVNQVGGGAFQMPALDGLKAWFRHGFAYARPLAVAEHLGWAWLIAGAFLGFYLFLALVFGRAVDTCARTFEESPGLTLATSLLTVLLLPVLTLLLAVTVVGPVLLSLAAFGGTLFGKAAFLNWLGRRVTVPLGLRLPVLATLIGGLLLVIFYLVPIVGFVAWKLSGVLGLGMVVYTIIASIQRERPAKPPRLPVAPAIASAGAVSSASAPAAAAPLAGGSAFFTAQSPEGTAAPGPGLEVPPVEAAPPLSALPRAGFWLRVAATVLDVILVVMVTATFNVVFVPVLALYCFVLWAFKGTTIGGIICGLKVVRLDDRPMDWKVALVRCLASFLSFIVAGLGFIWVAFDDERQSWHDKIAGTTIVRLPKGTPLL